MFHLQLHVHIADGVEGQLRLAQLQLMAASAWGWKKNMGRLSIFNQDTSGRF
jgi:hypothetical protein